MQIENVVLVDEYDVALGFCEKMEAHQKGLLHRAISVFVFNTAGEMLLQQRAYSKYHSGGLWTNSACSHPRIDESPIDAANRRLNEEMGLHCELQFAFTFVYKAELDKNLIEHELDHVFIGVSNAEPKINEEEVEDYRYVALDKLRIELVENPTAFTEWFKICVAEVLQIRNTK